MAKRRKKQVTSTKIKRFRKFDSQPKGFLNTGHMQAQPSPSATLPTRDAMSALWEGEFRQCIELFNRRKIREGFGRSLWLVWRRSTFMFVEEDFHLLRRSFSIFFGSMDRALSYVDNIPWHKTCVAMDETRIHNDRVVQSPPMWKNSRNLSI